MNVYVFLITIIIYGSKAADKDFKFQEKNSVCTTPNSESAQCIELSSCIPIKSAIATYNKTAINFAIKSQCGYDKEPLVCCGSTGYPENTDITNLFVKPEVRGPKSSVLPDRSLCGLEREHDRIIGGNVTAIDEFPWMVLLRYNDKFGNDAGFKCGGTLINNRYVLTAAHCIIGRVKLEFELSGVRLGEWDYNLDEDCIVTPANRECADPVIDMKVEEQIPHPYYTTRSANNDIALLRMEKPVEYSDFIRPICLPPATMPNPQVGTYMTVAGWGVKGKDEPLSSVKLKVEVPIVHASNCEKKLTTKRVTANQICAGGEKGKDSCSGDSGGPLMNFYSDSQTEQKQWYQEGVVSRGILECGTEGYPALYSRTARFLNWILSNLQD